MAFGRLVLLLALGGRAAAGVAHNALALTTPPAAAAAVDVGLAWQPFVHTRPALTGLRSGLLELVRRDTCLANGTNFCFGNNVHYCAACGTCCQADDANWCCPADSVCCGTACCGSGQTCSNGQCLLVTTMTDTVTVTTTATHRISEALTALEMVIVQAVSISVATLTATNQDNAATQTDWSYVTTTAAAVAQRAVPTPDYALSTDDPPGSSGRVDVPTTLARAVLRRDAEATAADLDPATTTTTVSEVLTATITITDTAISSTTVLTTSTNLSIVFATKTVIVGAVATVDGTSTITFVSSGPVTVTRTTIAIVGESDSPSSGTASPTPTAVLATGTRSGAAAHHSLSGGAIAGIAVGSVAGVLLAALLALLLVCRRRRRKRRAVETGDPYLGTGVVQHNYSGPPPPAAAGYGRGSVSTQGRGLPPVPFFTPPDGTDYTTDGQDSHPDGSQDGGHPTIPPKHHLRTASGATAVSSTVVGGASTRTSVSSAGKLAPAMASTPHGRNSSMGSGTTAPTLGQLDEDGVEEQPQAFAPNPSSPGSPPLQSTATAVPDGDTNRESAGWRGTFRRSRGNTVTQGGGFYYRDY